MKGIFVILVVELEEKHEARIRVKTQNASYRATRGQSKSGESTNHSQSLAIETEEEQEARVRVVQLFFAQYLLSITGGLL